MKKILLFLLALAYLLPAKSQDVYISTNSTVSFFSETPVENIDATSNQVVGALNVSTKTVFFKAKMTTFTFKKALMQEHFNENYVESDVFPDAVFVGKIIEEVDLTLDGTYEIRAKGKFTVHGVAQERIIKSSVTVKNGMIVIRSAFTVLLADHNIPVPKVVHEKLASEIKVEVNAELKQ